MKQEELDVLSEQAQKDGIPLDKLLPGFCISPQLEVEPCMGILRQARSNELPALKPQLCVVNMSQALNVSWNNYDVRLIAYPQWWSESKDKAERMQRKMIRECQEALKNELERLSKL
jgi:hypothetical protein